MQTMTKSIGRLALIAALALPLAACDTDATYSRGLQTEHQPVVSYASFIYDVQPGMSGDLSDAERQRLEGWLSSIGVAYGDRVSVATNASYYTPGLKNGIAAVVARHSLLLQEDPTAQAGAAPDGAVRLIVRRATASVPGCPDWSRNAENDIVGGLSSNFGCGVNGSLAAMVANPEDLVRGQTGEDSSLRTATSTRAIQTYQTKAPTGAGDLKALSAGGN